MAKLGTAFKPESIPDDPEERMANALRDLDSFISAGGLPPEGHQHLRGILSEWGNRGLQMRALGIHATIRDYRLFMLKRLDVS